MGISSKTEKRLYDVLSAMSATAGRQLIEAARERDPALCELIESGLERVDAAAGERFFAPLRAVSSPDPQAPPSRCLASPALLTSLWRWIRDDLAPDAARQIRMIADDAVAAHEADRGLDLVRESAGRAIQAALDEADGDPRAGRALRRRLGVSELDGARGIASALSCAGALSEALKDWPEHLPEISGERASQLHWRWERACEAAPEAGLWALFIAMAGLDRPWTILRVCGRISGRSDDLLVSRTDIIAIGEALLEDAAHYLAGFAQSPQTNAEAEQAAACLAAFARSTTGMTREIGIRKDGAWGRELTALRAQAASQMERVHARALALMDVLAPDPNKPRPRRWQPAAEPGDRIEERALAVFAFLRLAREDAGRAASGEAHRETLTAISLRLDTAGRALVDAMRRRQAPDDAAAQLETIGRLMTAMGESDSASILARRAAAASAA